MFHRARWLALSLLTLLPACALGPWRARPQPWGPETIAGAAEVRATCAEGTVLVLTDTRVVGTPPDATLVGKQEGEEHYVAFADLVRLETRSRVAFGPSFVPVCLPGWLFCPLLGLR